MRLELQFFPLITYPKYYLTIWPAISLNTILYDKSYCLIQKREVREYDFQLEYSVVIYRMSHFFSQLLTYFLGLVFDIYSFFYNSTIYTTTLNDIQNHISFQHMYKSNVITICRERTQFFFSCFQSKMGADSIFSSEFSDELATTPEFILNSAKGTKVTRKANEMFLLQGSQQNLIR